MNRSSIRRVIAVSVVVVAGNVTAQAVAVELFSPHQ